MTITWTLAKRWDVPSIKKPFLASLGLPLLHLDTVLASNQLASSLSFCVFILGTARPFFCYC